MTEEEHLSVLANVWPVAQSLGNFMFYSVSTVIVVKIFNLRQKLFNHVFYTPGVGQVKTKKTKSSRQVFIKSELGDIPITKVKAPSFDLELGFMVTKKKVETGIHLLEDFEINFEEEKIMLFPFFDKYWITSLVKPMDLANSPDICLV